MNIMKNIFLCLSLIGMLAACSKPVPNPDGPPPPPPPPGSPASKIAVTEVGQPTGPATIKTIGSGGGTITSADGKVVLTIPAGALDRNETISMEPIENKAPLGITALAYRFLPHGLQFKKPVSVSFKYHNPQIMGTPASQLKMATQLSNKTWRALGVSIDTNARTIKADLAHFSDYSVYTAYKLEDFKTKTDTAVVNMYTTERVRFRAIEEVELDSMLTIPMPAFPIEWAVNGKAQPMPGDNLGGFTSRDGYTMADRDYNAPRRPSKNDTIIAISAKMDLGSKGVLYLVRNVAVKDINKMMINGKNYDEVTMVATVIPGTSFMALQGFQLMPNGKYAQINIEIENFNVAPGTYTYTGSEKVRILADDETIHAWGSERTLIPSGVKEYTGTLEITVTGSLPYDLFFFGKISGTFFGVSGTVGNAPAELKFGIRAD